MDQTSNDGDGVIVGGGGSLFAMAGSGGGGGGADGIDLLQTDAGGGFGIAADDTGQVGEALKFYGGLAVEADLVK